MSYQDRQMSYQDRPISYQDMILVLLNVFDLIIKTIPVKSGFPPEKVETIYI